VWGCGLCVRVEGRCSATSVVEERRKKLEKRVINSEEQNSVIFRSHNMVFTMTDGKICTTVTSKSSTQACYLCDAAPKHMNCINEIVLRDADIKTYRFILSILHAWVRFFECLLHISNHLEIKNWQAKEKINGNCKIRKNKLKTSSKMKWVFW